MSRRFRLAEVAGLAREFSYAPPAARRRLLDAAERLLGELDPGAGYPLDFVVYRISGYRPEQGGVLLAGEALRHDLVGLIAAIARGLDLPAEDRPGGGLDLAAAAREAGVSARTLHRWRDEGLATYPIRFADGSVRVGCARAALRLAAGRRRPPRAPRRSDAAERSRVLARFDALRARLVAPTRAAGLIAEEFSRSREGVRKILRRAGRWEGRAPRRLDAKSFARVLLRAADQLIPPAVVAARHARDPIATAKLARRLRRDRVRAIVLPRRWFATFELPDAARVIPNAEVVGRGHAEAWMPLDAVRLVEESRDRMPARRGVVEIETLLAAEAWLLRIAAEAIPSLLPNESSLDPVETAIRRAGRIRQRLGRRLLPVVIARLEQSLGGPLLARTAGEVRALLDLAWRSLASILDGYEPTAPVGRGRSLMGVISLGLDRAIAPVVEGLRGRRASARHASLGIDDPRLVLAPWLAAVDAASRFRGAVRDLDPAARRLLERRHGWGEEAPHSLRELAAVEGGSLPRLLRRLAEAQTALRMSSRHRAAGQFFGQTSGQI